MAILQTEAGNGELRESMRFTLEPQQPNYLYIRRKRLQLSIKPTSDQLCVIIHTRRSGWVVIDYSGHDVYVDGMRVVDCKQLRTGSSIQFKLSDYVGEVVLYEVAEVTVQPNDTLLLPDSNGEVPECKFDYTIFIVGDVVVLCPDCGKPSHQRCWKENENSCPNCGYHNLVSEIKMRKS